MGVRRRARVKTDMAQAVHNDTIDQVDCLSGPGQIHLSPVVLRGGGAGVTPVYLKYGFLRSRVLVDTVLVPSILHS